MRLCGSHPIRYFFNLKLDDINELSLFHKIILLENNPMFNSLLDFFSNKFKEEIGQITSKDSNSPKDSINSKLYFYQFEEKKTSDTDYPNELTLTKLLSLQDKDGNTPMLFAAYKGNLEIIIKLIDLGVKYDVRNKAGLDVIQMAAQNDMANVIIFFKEKYNCDLFLPDLMGNNSIHWACSNCAKTALGYLLFYINDKNADIINSVNKNNQTALHLTILTNESISIIKKLIKKGIKLDIKDKFGMTVFDIAKNNPKYLTSTVFLLFVVDSYLFLVEGGLSGMSLSYILKVWKRTVASVLVRPISVAFFNHSFIDILKSISLKI
jgi:ankyrin repeat protein